MLIILTACGQAIETIPTANYVPAEQTAKIQDKIVQDVNIKDVNAQNNSCKNEMCNGVCNGNCEQKKCGFWEEYGKEGCECESGKRYCETQNKCIERGKCCEHTDCKKTQRCTPTIYQTTLCFKTDSKTTCKIMSNDQRAVFSVNEKDYTAKAVKWWSDNSVAFEINNKTIELMNNSSTAENSITILRAETKIIGGNCKEEE